LIVTLVALFEVKLCFQVKGEQVVEWHVVAISAKHDEQAVVNQP